MIGLHESLTRDQADILDLAIKRLREKRQHKAVLYLLQIRQNGDVLEGDTKQPLQDYLNAKSNMTQCNIKCVMGEVVKHPKEEGKKWDPLYWFKVARKRGPRE